METDHELTTAAVNAFPRIADFTLRERLRFIQACKDHVLQAMASGDRNPERLLDKAEATASEDQAVYGSPVLLVIVLGAVLSWLIQRILDRIFPPGSAE